MKTISTTLAAHIAGEVTTLATCWKLTRRDSTIFGFTDHDSDITYSGITYKAATGFTPTALQNSGSLKVDNLEVDGMLSAGSITEADILAGLYDFAEIDIFQLNYKDLSQGDLKLRRGWLGEVSLRQQQFVAEVRGLSQCFSQNMGQLYSASCRVALGDARCKVNLASYTVTGIITSVTSNAQFADTSRTETTDVYSGGKITFTSGANTGLSMEVKQYQNPGTGGIITLALALPYSVSVGDHYTLIQGCDKTIHTCYNRFNNVVNFRGEPLVPGLDRSLETAGTRSTW